MPVANAAAVPARGVLGVGVLVDGVRLIAISTHGEQDQDRDDRVEHRVGQLSSRMPPSSAPAVVPQREDERAPPLARAARAGSRSRR